MGLVLVAIVHGQALASDPGLDALREWQSSPQGAVAPEVLKSLVRDRLQREAAALPPSVRAMVSVNRLVDTHVRRFHSLPRVQGERFKPLRALVGGVWAAEGFADFLELPPPVWVKGFKEWRGDRSLDGWLDTTRSTGFLAVDPTKSTLDVEYGGGGSRNGHPDAGEWVQLSIALRRRTELPLFSTSVFGLRTTSDCVWMPRGREEELLEFRDEDPPTTLHKLTVVAWISKDCARIGKVGFSMEVADSGWRGGARETLAFDLRLGRAPVAGRVNARLESDLPGYSRGANKVRVYPGKHFELSIGLEVPGASFVSVYHHMGLLDKVVRQDDRKDFPWKLKLHGGRFVPTNDHDFKVRPLTEYRRWLWSNRKWPWMKGESPNLLTAVDAVVVTTSSRSGGASDPGLYIQRVYVLVPLAYIPQPPPPPPPPPRPPPPPPPVERVVPTAQPHIFVLGMGVGILPVNYASGFGIGMPFVLSIKGGTRLKGVFDGAFGSATVWYGANHFQVGGRYALKYEPGAEVGPYLSIGSRELLQVPGQSANFLTRFGFSGEHYLQGDTRVLGFYWNAAITNTSSGISTWHDTVIRTAPVWMDLGVVVGF